MVLNINVVEQDDEVDLKASQKDEDYVKPFEVFTGSGNRLGAPITSPTPAQVEAPIVQVDTTPKLDGNDPANMILQIRKSNGERTSFVCKRSSTVAEVNTLLGGLLFHSFPRKQVESLSGCEKEVLLLV